MPETTTSREHLIGAFKHLKPCISKHTHLPVLQHFLLKSTKQGLVIRATDMELSAECVLPAEFTKPFEVLVKADEFMSSVKAAEKGVLTLSLEGGLMNIKAQGSSTTLNALPPDDFPAPVAMGSDTNEVRLPAIVLLDALQLGTVAKSKDATKPTLSGILLHATSKGLKVVSTDGFRLAIYDIPTDLKIEGDHRFIIPATALKMLPAKLADQDTVCLSWDGTQVQLSWPGTTLAVRRVVGNYPAYEKVVPATPPNYLQMDRKALLKALESVKVKSDDYSKNVRLQFSHPDLTVSFTHPDKGTATSSLPYTGYAHPIELAFNIDYLIDVVKALGSEDIIYRFKDDVGQGTFCAHDLPEFSYILMPVRFAKEA